MVLLFYIFYLPMIFGVFELYWTQEIKNRQETGKRQGGGLRGVKERECGLECSKCTVYLFNIFKE